MSSELDDIVIIVCLIKRVPIVTKDLLLAVTDDLPETVLVSEKCVNTWNTYVEKWKHWHRPVKNIGGSAKILGDGVMNTWAFLNYLGAAPKSTPEWRPEELKI